MCQCPVYSKIMLSYCMNTIELYNNIAQGITPVGLHTYAELRIPLPSVYHPKHVNDLINTYQTSVEGLPQYRVVALLQEYSQHLSLDDYVKMSEHVKHLEPKTWAELMFVNINLLDNTDFYPYCYKQLQESLRNSDLKYSYIKHLHKAKQYGLVDYSQFTREQILEELFLYTDPHEHYQKHKDMYHMTINEALSVNDYKLISFIEKCEKFNIDEERMQHSDIVIYHLNHSIRNNKSRLLSNIPESLLPYVNHHLLIYGFYSDINVHSSVMSLIKNFEKIKPYLGEHAEKLYEGINIIANTFLLENIHKEFRHMQHSIIRDVDDIIHKLMESCPNTMMTYFKEKKALYESMGLAYNIEDALLEFGTNIEISTYSKTSECDIIII